MSDTPKQDVTAWRKSAAHLPPALRDFHDQKEVFKTIDEMYQRERGKSPVPPLAEISWIDGQIYTIDFFLWFMARHGYTLQRSRARVEFADLNETVGARRERDDKQFAALLGFKAPQQDAAHE